QKIQQDKLEIKKLRAQEKADAASARRRRREDYEHLENLLRTHRDISILQNGAGPNDVADRGEVEEVTKQQSIFSGERERAIHGEPSENKPISATRLALAAGHGAGHERTRICALSTR